MLQTHLDYETASEADIRLGVWAYARHPTTRLLWASWATGEEDPHLWTPGKKFPDSLQRAFDEHELYCFSPFEIPITEVIMAKHGFVAPQREQWNDVQAMARMCGLPPNLGRLAAALKLKERKDKKGEDLIKLFSMPQPRSKIMIMPKDRPDDFKDFGEYCRQDVRTERGVHNKLPIKRLPSFERKVWQVDLVVNERGVKIDRTLAQGAMKLRNVAKALGNKRLSEMTKGKVTSCGQRDRIIAMAKKINYKLINLTKETVAAVLSDDTCPPLIRKVLELRNQTNMSSLAKFAAMLRTADLVDDRIRDTHVYHAAGPGRWGGKDVQFQNVPRPVIHLGAFEHDCIRKADAASLELLHGELLPLLRDALRNCIVAEKGHELFVVDKASIEARCLGWVAGCKGYQEAFRTGRDLYIVCAAGIFGKEYDAILKGYKADIWEFVEYRKTGKDSVLALGYGQGDGTNPGDTGGFLNYCLKKGGKMTPLLARKTVRAFRTKLFPEIPKLWYETERLAIRCVQTGKTQRMGGTDGRPVIIFEMIGTYLTIKLPSSRRLWYPQAHVKLTVNKWGQAKPQLRFWGEYKKKFWRIEWTYGGKLVENIIQGIARDLLALALVTCERLGLRPVMHVHDEIVCEVPKKDLRTLDEMHGVFRTVPVWGDGLLLGSGGFVTLFYRK